MDTFCVFAAAPIGGAALAFPPPLRATPCLFRPVYCVIGACGRVSRRYRHRPPLERQCRLRFPVRVARLSPDWGKPAVQGRVDLGCRARKGQGWLHHNKARFCERALTCSTLSSSARCSSIRETERAPAGARIQRSRFRFMRQSGTRRYQPLSDGHRDRETEHDGRAAYPVASTALMRALGGRRSDLDRILTHDLAHPSAAGHHPV